MEWTTVASMMARTSLQAYNHRQIINLYWKKVLAHFKAGATEIVVTGHAGVGKSMLAGQLHGRARQLYFEVPDESIQVEVDAITIGEWARLMRVLPGQGARRTHGEIDIFEKQASLEGIIHVVDYGYVRPRDAAHATALQASGMKSIEDLREFNLRSELADFNALSNTIVRMQARVKRPKWLLIAVNKFDLFASKEADALAYYHPDGTGQFGRALSSLRAKVGSDSLGVYVVPSAAYELDFEWNDQVVKTSLARREQDEILRDFVKTLAWISERHE